MKYKYITLLLCFFCLGVLAQNQEADSVEKNLKITAVAIPLKNPEFGWHLQGGAIGTYSTKPSDSTLRKSNTYLFLLVSQNKQYSLSTGSQILTPDEKFFIGNWTYFSYMPNLFYEFEKANKQDEYEGITSIVSHFDADVLYNIYSKWYAGGRFILEKESSIESVSLGKYQSGSFAGKNGYVVAGAGARLRYDSRDDLLWPSSGYYMDFYALPFFSSEVNFSQYLIDMRRYFPDVVLKESVLALKVVADLVDNRKAYYRFWPSVSGRAFHDNMLRYQRILNLAVDYQFKLWGAFYLSAFYEPSFAQPLKNMFFFDSYGGGVRLSLSKKERLFFSFEYAASKYSSNPHITFSSEF